MAHLNLTIISSFHKTYGNCNPSELYKIIEKLNPEIIFEELSNIGFEFIYSPNYQPETIEAYTIKEYLKKHPIKHFPVDNYPVNEFDLFNDAQFILDNSSRYRELWELKMKRIFESGYSFLNSEECSEILIELNKIEEEVLIETNNSKMLNELKAEALLHEKRESAMLDGIINLANQFPFNNAIFISGAEHKEGFRKKIKVLETNKNIKIKWIFYNDPADTKNN